MQTKYATRDDFKSADQYATYVRGLIVPGMTVRCCRDFEEIRKGDIGTVLKVDTEGLHDLNVQVDWQMHGATYWMCFVHIELIEPPDELPVNAQPIAVGSQVRIKDNVVKHRFMGSIYRGSVGTVTAITGQDVTVDFPQQIIWSGSLSEIESVNQCPNTCQINPINSATHLDGELIEDWSRCIRSLTVSSNESLAKHLLDKTTNCWQSNAQGKHWIRLELHENVLINMLAITVNPTDCSHMPSLVVVRIGDSIETLKDFSWVSVKPTDEKVPLLSEMRTYHHWIEIVIKQCRNNGIQCKVNFE